MKKGQDVLDRLAGRECTEKGSSSRDYSTIINLIKVGATDFFRQHKHIEFQKDSEHVLWLKCLDCNQIWNNCDFCEEGPPRPRQASIKLPCKWNGRCK